MVLDHIALVAGLAPAQLDGISFQQIGLELALFKFLEARGVLQVNWKKITNASANVTDTAQEGGSAGADYLDSLLSTLPVSAGFTGGFFLGFKKG